MIPNTQEIRLQAQILMKAGDFSLWFSKCILCFIVGHAAVYYGAQVYWMSAYAALAACVGAIGYLTLALGEEMLERTRNSAREEI